MHRRRKVGEKSCVTFLLCDPAGTSNKPDVQNKWEENTQHNTLYYYCDLHFNVMILCFSSHLFWTSSSLDVPAGVTQEEGHTGFLIHLPSAVRALIFLAIRIQPFLSLVDREVEFCVLTI